MIPLATTTITITRPGVPEADVDNPYADYVDATETPDAESTTVASGVRAVFSQPSGLERIVAGSQESIDWTLLCDVCDLSHNDTVTDDTTGEVYTVQWAHLRPGMGLDHVMAGLRRISGDQ